MYFARLAVLKPAVEKIAGEAWDDFEVRILRVSTLTYGKILRRKLQVGGEKARRVDRVLDVRQGELVWVVGTVYMEMPLKPNILDDISKDVCWNFKSYRFGVELT